jgi:DNA-binding beta-propeller fold protein YncE
MIRKISLVLLSVFLFIGCEDDEPTKDLLTPEQRHVVIINEGNFQSANGSISAYYPETGSVAAEVFQAANQGRPLGDVPQSISQIGERYFIVVNNSNKIEVVDRQFNSLGKIDGLNSPRYVKEISATEIVVSDLYQDELYLINSNNYQQQGVLESKGWIEEMEELDNRLYTCHVDSNQVWVWDLKNDTIITKINTNKQPQSMVIDKNEMLWVACSGGIQDGFPALIQIDPRNNTILKKIEVPDKDKSIAALEINPAGDHLLFLMGDVFEMSIADTTFPSQEKIKEGGRLFYGLGVDPFNGDIYVSDAIDYLQKGVVYRYSKGGELQQSFKVGIIPGGFFFPQ